MSNGWSAKSVISNSSVVIGASQSNVPVTLEFPVSAGGALHFVAKISAASVTVGAGITAKLQTAINGDWEDSKTVSITGNGNFYIKLLAEAAGDQTYLPLLNKCRVVVTTTAGSAITVTAVDELHEL